MLYEVWVHFSGDYCCEVEAENDNEAKDLAREVFFDEDDVGELSIDRYTVYELDEEE